MKPFAYTRAEEPATAIAAVAQAPEPSSGLLALLSLGGLSASAWWRKRRPARA